MPDPTARFDPAAYGPAVAVVLDGGKRLAVLDMEGADERFRSAIEGLEIPQAALVGLWLYRDFWHEAHEVAQSIDDPDGSFWHAILHRRESDAANSNYWWRRVGDHPVLATLRRDAAELGFPDFTPSRFVKACERGDNEDVLRRVQLREWQLLFDHCWRSATG